MAISGLSRVRTELFQLTVIPALTPHPIQMYRQFPGHRYLRDLSSSAQGKVEELAADVAAFLNSSTSPRTEHGSILFKTTAGLNYAAIWRSH